MATVKFKFPKLKYTIWYRLFQLISFLNMDDMKIVEYFMRWLIKHKKIVAKLGKDKVYFYELL